MSAEVPVAYTMVERPALTPLVLHACLLPTTSVSAIEAAAAGVATSSLVAECTSQMASVILHVLRLKTIFIQHNNFILESTLQGLQDLKIKFIIPVSLQYLDPQLILLHQPHSDKQFSRHFDDCHLGSNYQLSPLAHQHIYDNKLTYTVHPTHY